MKRSEMVQTIVDYLHLLETEDIDHSKEDQAEYILGTVETFGMLPPYSNPENIKGYDLIYSNPEKLHQWEKEDE